MKQNLFCAYLVSFILLDWIDGSQYIRPFSDNEKGLNNINPLDCLNAFNTAKFAFYASYVAKFAFYQFNSPAIDTFVLSQRPGQLPLTILYHQTLFFPTLSLHIEAALLIITNQFPDDSGECQGHLCSANTIYSSGLKTHQQQEFQT